MTHHLFFLHSSPLQFRRHKSNNLHRSSPVASSRPPQPKPGFYKNPSRAIEKGGGFYIPGLRGPRLRIAVSTLTATLLSLNHLAAGPAVTQTNLLVSEALAATGSFSVFATAIVDIFTEQDEKTVSPVQPAIAISPPVAEQAKGASGSEEKEVVSWVEAVVKDLAGASAVAVCCGGKTVYASGLAVGGVEAGEVSGRVASAGRALYVDDSSSLPAEATLPFLEQGTWAVYLVPVEEDVVAFARERTNGGFGVADRAWLAQIAGRVSRGCK